MTRRKNARIFFSFLLVISMVASCFMSMAVPSAAIEADAAGPDHAYRYFYSQLQPNAKKIYDAMYEMYTTDVFKRGDDFSLSENGYVTESQLASFASGDQQLLNDYGAARDAFQNDYPDCFYVDFDLLTVRVTQDTNKNLHGYLGKGRSTTYFQKGINANNVQQYIDEYESKIQEIVTSAQQTSVEDGENETVEKIGAVHDYLVKHMIYHFENEVTDKRSNARTAYDGIVCGEGVCEAYTRSFKAVLDRMDIPCTSVYGVYRPNDKINESHIWNAVQIDGKWYAVDVTHDDPTNDKWTNKNSTHETRENFLIGQLELSADHFESAIMSSANYEFDYPDVELNAYSEEYMAETGDPDLKVKVVKESFFDDWSKDHDDAESGGIYCISYRGKNYTQNEADGYYLLAKYYTYTPGTDTWEVSDWGYLDPECYVFGGDPDQIKDFEPDEEVDGMGHVFRLALPMVKKAQFAVTTIAPSFKKLEGMDKQNDIFLNRGMYYKGNPSLLKTVSKEIENQWGDYVAPPYTVKLSPYQAAQLKIGGTYHMEWTFDDKLIPNNEEDFDVELVETTSSGGDAGSSTGKQFSKIENEKLTGDSTVEFDFTPSKQFADDYCFYTFQVKGVMGEKSLKAPIPVTYCASYPCSAYAYQAQGFDWNVYGKPQLLESSDLDTSEWQDNSGGDVDLDKLTHRLTLVTTSTNPGEEKQMTEALENSKYANDFSKAQVTNTYNIRLTLCKAQVVSTGQGVRVSVGFPAGTSYEDFAEKGTLEFKAYHYIVDPETNLLTGEVEEIPITVTPLGLIITVKSFSPFAITAITGDGQKPENKSLVIASSENGKITDESGETMEGANGIVTFEPGTTKTFTISSDPEYDIDNIKVNETAKQVDNEDQQQIKISYSDLPEVTNYLTAEMVAESVHQEEESRQESHTFTEILPASITFPKTEYVLEPGNELTITPEVDLHNEQASAEYKWYKDGSPLNDKTSKELSIESVSAQDAGTYTLHVTTTLSNDTVETTSEEIKVTVEETTLNVSQSLDLKLTDKYQFTNVVAPKGKEVSYDSDTKDTVDVDKDGVLTLKQVGSAKITVRSGSKSAECQVSVSKPDISSISLSAKDITLNVGDERQLTVDSFLPKEASIDSTSWSAEDNDDVIKVGSDGTVTALKGGTATVKATVNGNVTGTCKVTVRASLQSVALNKTDLDIKVNNQVLLNVLPTPAEAYVGKITWDSNNKQSATVNESGLVQTTAVPGEADITASVSGHDLLTCHLDVLKEPVTGFSLVRTQNTDSINVGSKTKLYRVSNITPSGATYTTVKWSSDTPQIMSVDETTGEITGLTAGKGVLRATVDEMTKTANINIVKVPVKTVTLSQKTLNLVEGAEETLTADVQPPEASLKDVAWSTDNKGIADVDQQGRVTATGVGQTDIKATADGITDTCHVVVSKAEHPLEDIKLDTAELTLKVGEKHSFSITYEPADAPHGTPEWSVYPESIATITQNGELTARKDGHARVTVTVGNEQATCDVTVTKDPVQSVKLSSDTLSLSVGAQQQLTAEVSPDNATFKTVTWTTDREEVADVDEFGYVTAKGIGEAHIKATADGVTATCTVTVTKAVTPLNRITLDTDNLTLKPNQKHEFTLTFVPGESDHGGAVWSIDRSDIAEISQLGTLTAKKVGEAEVTVRVDDKEATCHVSVVKEPVQSVNLSDTTLTMTEGTVHRLIATILPETATYPEVTWKSDQPEIAKVDQSGNISAERAGRATITATADGVVGTCELTVKELSGPLQSVALDVNKLTLKETETHDFRLSVFPEGASHGTPSWSVEKPDVAEITQDGHLTAKAMGKTNVTVNVDGHEDTCVVTVEKLPVESIELSRTQAEVAVGQSVDIAGTVIPEKATYPEISWSSDDASIASIENGQITGHAAGTTNIRATADGVEAVCKVIVVQEEVPLKSVKLDQTSITMKDGETQILTFTVNPTHATYSHVSWTSSNSKVATVNEFGHVTAVGVGNATISVVVDGKESTCHVVVEKGPETQTPGASTATKRALSDLISAAAKKNPGTYTATSWNAYQAAVNSAKKLMANDDGSVTEKEYQAAIQAVKNAASKLQKIPTPTVKKVKVTKITLSSTLSNRIAATKTVQLTAKVYPSNADNKAVHWTTNSKYATVSHTGLVRPKKAGIGRTITIRATAADGYGTYGTYKIKVMKSAVKKIKLKANPVKAGKSTKVKATIVTTGKKANTTLKWTSSNTKYASVNSAGKVKTYKAGKGKKVTITAAAMDGSGVKKSVKVKIK